MFFLPVYISCCCAHSMIELSSSVLPSSLVLKPNVSAFALTPEKSAVPADALSGTNRSRLYVCSNATTVDNMHFTCDTFDSVQITSHLSAWMSFACSGFSRAEMNSQLSAHFCQTLQQRTSIHVLNDVADAASGIKTVKEGWKNDDSRPQYS